MNGRAELVPAGLRLSAEIVDLWVVSTEMTAAELARLEMLLSAEERERIERLRISAKRVEALVSRGVLRQVLGMLLGKNPAGLVFGTGAHGKPFLADAGAEGRGAGGRGGVRFNLSHTAGRVLLAVTLEREVGVDIERVRTTLAHEELARRYFTAQEAEAIGALPPTERPRAFFTCWCRKEAVLKALGVGISGGLGGGGLNAFAAPVGAAMEPLRVAYRDSGGESRWWLHDVAVEEPYVASVAVPWGGAALRRWPAPVG